MTSPQPEYSKKFIMAFYAVSDELDKLATQGSPEQIRDYLQTRKVAPGVPCNSRNCPVHNLVAKVADGFEVVVTPGTTTVRAPDITASVSTPLAVAEFISAFDAKRFPELIKPGAR